MYQISRIFLVIGGIDLGIIGIGNFLGSNLNIIELFSQFNPMLPTIFYLIIGASAIIWMFKSY